MKIKVQTTSDSAHWLPLHSGKCSRLHGHTYHLIAEVEGPVGMDGMVVDFGIVKEILRKFDHQCINSVARDENIPSLENPTAEHLAEYFSHQILKALPKAQAVMVEVWETEDCYARTEVRREGTR